MPTLHIDDAIEHLVGYLRDEITKPPSRMPVSDDKFGCDLWVPIVVANFWQSRGHPTVSADPRQPQDAAYYRPFYDAVWQLCRIGVLRPGETAPMGSSTHGRGFTGDGFSLTELGRDWVQTAAQHPPSDPSRFSDVVQPFISRFGEGFAQRAVEASRCYQTTNYLACCVMAGAAAESILLAVATAKVGDEGTALKEYRRAEGRKKIIDRITGGLQQGLRERFVTAGSILNFWRDEAAHGTRTTITAVQAQFSLAQLLQFAQLTTDNWDTLTQGPPAPAPTDAGNAPAGGGRR
jgi:hypothetical protein